ncbi:hypothetical protein K525DRAFT_280062 [Schizophyllum commune Loenen D]|nr:hypothetical protein K525DRAFT_280062 [Schizophyllum commune Loenen D]
MASPALIPGSILSTDGVLIGAGPSSSPCDDAYPSMHGQKHGSDTLLRAQLTAATLTDDAILALLASAEHTEEGEETTARGWRLCTTTTAYLSRAIVGAMRFLVLRSPSCDHPSCVPPVLLTAHHPPTTYHPRPHPTDMTSHHRDRRTRARRPVADVYSLAGHRTTHHHRSIVVGAVAGLVHSGRLVVLAIYLSAALSAFSCTLLMPCIHARLSLSRSVQYLCRVDRHARRWQL